MHKRLNLNQHSSLRTAQTQHRTVLMVVHFILQIIIIAHMMSTGGEGTETLRAVHTECGAEQLRTGVVIDFNEFYYNGRSRERPDTRIRA